MKLNSKKIKINYLNQKGITLIALVITIVVLLILAGVSINAIFSENGIINKAKDAQNKMDQATQNDLDAIDGLSNWIDSKTNKNTGGPTVTINGSTVTLTKDNVYEYLGKKVTNYTGKSSVTVGDSEEYTVSTEYRLYYVDFDNKYGDGAGTIYLKAECTSDNYVLELDESLATDTNIKIKALNPSLYAGEAAPDSLNENMQAVTWLTNTTNWASLADTTMSSNINYIVGAPSLEMMMDSYNTHYRLTGDTPDYTPIEAETRRKLFYKYTSGEYGYQVGPCADDSAEYGYYTPDNSVYTDPTIDSMYYPGDGQYYWLASPSAYSSYGVMFVRYDYGGYVNCVDYSNDYLALCPVVSLKSNVQLQLQ